MKDIAGFAEPNNMYIYIYLFICVYTWYTWFIILEHICKLLPRNSRASDPHLAEDPPSADDGVGNLNLCQRHFPCSNSHQFLICWQSFRTAKGSRLPAHLREWSKSCCIHTVKFFEFVLKPAVAQAICADLFGGPAETDWPAWGSACGLFAGGPQLCWRFARTNWQSIEFKQEWLSLLYAPHYSRSDPPSSPSFQNNYRLKPWNSRMHWSTEYACVFVDVRVYYVHVKATLYLCTWCLCPLRRCLSAILICMSVYMLCVCMHACVFA